MCCGVAENVKAAVQRVASKAQDAGKLASVLGASALIAGVSSMSGRSAFDDGQRPAITGRFISQCQSTELLRNLQFPVVAGLPAFLE